jgi:S-methylmethionine-dependent homocysteine/selenocysteine methylase
MSTKTKNLPQMKGGLFLTDGGLETSLIFHEGWELPHFAAFNLLKDEAGTAALRTYYERYLAIARANGLGFVLESPTWRASADWGDKLGYSREGLADANRRSIALMSELRNRFAGAAPIVVSGNVGPRGDGYDPGTIMTADEAQAYHGVQIGSASARRTGRRFWRASPRCGHGRPRQAPPRSRPFHSRETSRLPRGYRR